MKDPVVCKTKAVSKKKKFSLGEQTTNEVVNCVENKVQNRTYNLRPSKTEVMQEKNDLDKS